MVFSTYHENLDKFEYYTSPPEDWGDVDKKRVKKHFEDFNLARRYAIKAAERLRIVMLQIKSMKEAGIDSGDIQSAFLQPGVDAAPFLNHWQKGMYQALIKYYERSK